jgi:hypothetical protein
MKAVERKPENRKMKSRFVQHKTKNSGRTARPKHRNTRRTKHRKTEQKDGRTARPPAKTREASPRRRDAGELPVVTHNHKARSHHQDYGSTSLTARFGFLGGGSGCVSWLFREKGEKSFLLNFGTMSSKNSLSSYFDFGLFVILTNKQLKILVIKIVQ